MLRHAKVMEALISLQDELFQDISSNIALARAAWQALASDPLFAYKIREIDSPWLLPTWQGSVDAVYDVLSLQEPYQVIAVDGSQIYPDRHQGSSCYLINIGGVHFSYGVRSSAQCESTPYLYSGRSEDELEMQVMDVVNAKRQELELRTGLIWGQEIFQEAIPELFLFDGSLIFWHLASQSVTLQEHYMHCYINSMNQLYEDRIAYAGYISLPKSKELVNLIRVQLCNFVVEGCMDHKEVDHLVDATVAGFFLKPGQRTTVFKSNAIICKKYPEHLVPYFFYLHAGNEIARVEIPAWIALDEHRVQSVASIMYDQSIKGNGYPISLAESHEQAVVKGPDRDFFYQLVQKLAVDHKKQQQISQKSAKKRMIGV